MGWPTGFEPATTSSTSLDSTIELRPPTSFDMLIFSGRGVKFAHGGKTGLATEAQRPQRGAGGAIYYVGGVSLGWRGVVGAGSGDLAYNAKSISVFSGPLPPKTNDWSLLTSSSTGARSASVGQLGVNSMPRKTMLVLPDWARVVTAALAPVSTIRTTRLEFTEPP